MKRIASFKKVSKTRFVEDYNDSFSNNGDAELVYDEIKLPKRATKGSAGYDFFLTADISLNPGETAKIPTGIRAEMEEGWVSGSRRNR